MCVKTTDFYAHMIYSKLHLMENAASCVAFGSLGYGLGRFMVLFERASLLLAHQLIGTASCIC